MVDARWTILLRDCAPTATESLGLANGAQGQSDAIIKGFARASKDRTIKRAMGSVNCNDGQIIGQGGPHRRHNRAGRRISRASSTGPRATQRLRGWMVSSHSAFATR